MDTGANLLNEIAAKAKWEGVVTQEWTTIRSCVFRNGLLESFAGANPIQKLATWAENEGLLIDLGVECHGFSAEIGTITFWSAHQGQAQPPAVPVNVEHVAAEQDCVIHDDFDWGSVASTESSDDEVWAALSREVDFAFIGDLGGPPAEMNGDITAEATAEAVMPETGFARGHARGHIKRSPQPRGRLAPGGRSASALPRSSVPRARRQKSGPLVAITAVK